MILIGRSPFDILLDTKFSFKSGLFGASCTEALQRTTWLFLSLHFGFRARVTLGRRDHVQDSREVLVWINERRKRGKKMATIVQ